MMFISRTDRTIHHQTNVVLDRSSGLLLLVLAGFGFSPSEILQ